MIDRETEPFPLPNSRALQQHLFSSLQSCKTMRNLTQLHAQIVVNGYTQKNFLLAKLLAFCIASGNLLYAQQAFEQIGSPTTVLYNHMIRGFAASDSPEKSLLVYKRMEGTDARPDGYTFSFLLSSCTRPFFDREGEQLHGKTVLSGLDLNVVVQTNLINMYAVTGGVENDGMGKARQIFDLMPQRSLVTWNSLLVANVRFGDLEAACKLFEEMPERNVVSWTTMMAGCAETGKTKQALAFFYEMRKAHVQVDQVALVAALSVCAELGDLNLGRWIHAIVYKGSCTGLQQEHGLVSLNNALIHMYARCGLLKDACRIFQEMPQRSVVSWTTMIIGFAMHGHGEDALAIFKEMQKMKVQPDEVTFIGVLCACSHAGWVNEGCHYFETMTRVWKIKPRIVHYGCMVDLLSRAGRLDEAYELITAMPMEPNSIIWGTILSGCRVHKNVQLASSVAGQFTELEPDQAVGHLTLLSNVYAAAKNWDDVVRVRQRMAEMGLKKNPGCSSIQVNGVIHDFLAGDQRHRETAAICEMVRKIAKQAESADYMTDDAMEVLLDIEAYM